MSPILALERLTREEAVADEHPPLLFPPADLLKEDWAAHDLFSPPQTKEK